MIEPGSSSPPGSATAERYFTVDLEEIITLRRWTRFRHRVRPLAMELLLGWVSGGFEQAEEPTKIIVKRRSDGMPLVTYDYDYRLEAIRHRDLLRARLRTEHIFDLCRQLGIDISEVSAPQDG